MSVADVWLVGKQGNGIKVSLPPEIIVYAWSMNKDSAQHTTVTICGMTSGWLSPTTVWKLPLQMLYQGIQQPPAFFMILKTGQRNQSIFTTRNNFVSINKDSAQHTTVTICGMTSLPHPHPHPTPHPHPHPLHPPPHPTPPPLLVYRSQYTACTIGLIYKSTSSTRD